MKLLLLITLSLPLTGCFNITNRVMKIGDVNYTVKAQKIYETEKSHYVLGHVLNDKDKTLGFKFFRVVPYASGWISYTFENSIPNGLNKFETMENLIAFANSHNFNDLKIIERNNKQIVRINNYTFEIQNYHFKYKNAWATPSQLLVIITIPIDIVLTPYYFIRTMQDLSSIN